MCIVNKKTFKYPSTMIRSSINIFSLLLLFNFKMFIKWLLIKNVLQMSKENNLEFFELVVSNPKCRLLKIQ